MNGSGRWHAEQAWLGHRGENVLIEVEAGRIKTISEGAPAPPDAVALQGWTIPGLANVHSHAFQRLLRGEIESGGGDFWEWRDQMYRFTEWRPADYFNHGRLVFREMLEAGITAVGEFHYLHGHGNELGEALIDAAREEGIRITLIDACYLRGAMDGRPLEGEQLTFSDDRHVPLHIHLAEQPAEVEECEAVEGCTPAELLEREGILGPDLTAVHAIHLDERDIILLGDSQVSICACPTTERDLGDRVGPLRALAGAGCALSVGSDSNVVIDMLEEARGLELDQRRATGRRVLHQPEQLLRAATVNGMRALGWEAGELKEGMLADFITLAQPNGLWRELGPAYLVYGYSGRDVTNVVVGGETVVQR